jgi:hypothetical protein
MEGRLPGTFPGRNFESWLFHAQAGTLKIVGILKKDNFFVTKKMPGPN